jgi:flagellar hook-associated protein 2
MQITGTYNNYMAMTGLLAPMGVKDSGNLVMQVFASAMEDLQGKINQQIFSKESDTALKGLYSKVSGLANQADKLTLTDYNSVFFDRTGTSSDTNVLTATADDAFSQDSGATEATYGISVSQLALAQENTGLELNMDDVSGVNVGTNTFNVNIDGEDHELSIEVEAGDTNETVAEKMATALNNASIGVTAEVVAGSTEGTQQFVITGEETGTGNVFTISDVSGNAVAATGAGATSTAVQDAEYSVDGTDYTSESNTIYLDDGFVSVSLKGTGEASLTIEPDQNEVKNAVTAFVSGVNSFIGHLESNSDYINDEVLASINAFVSDHKNELESFGITQGDDGKLEIDDDKLTAAVSDNLEGIQDAFGGLDGLAVQTKNYASQIATDSPLNYAKEAEGMGADIADYFYGTSASMLQNILQGALINTFI